MPCGLLSALFRESCWGWCFWGGHTKWLAVRGPLTEVKIFRFLAVALVLGQPPQLEVWADRVGSRRALLRGEGEGPSDPR